MFYLIALAILGSIVAGFMFGYVAAGALMTSAGLAEQQENDKLRSSVDNLHSMFASANKEAQLYKQAAERLQAENGLLEQSLDRYRAKVAELQEIENGDFKTWQAVA